MDFSYKMTKQAKSLIILGNLLIVIANMSENIFSNATAMYCDVDLSKKKNRKPQKSHDLTEYVFVFCSTCA